MAHAFTHDNYTDEVANSDIPVMIDFYADWCGPCRMMGPVVDELSEKYAGRVKIGKVNSDQQPELAQMFNVTSIPNFVFIKNGTVVDNALGAMPAHDLEKRIEAML